MDDDFVQEFALPMIVAMRRILDDAERHGFVSARAKLDALERTTRAGKMPTREPGE